MTSMFHLLKSLLNNLIFFLFPKLLELFFTPENTPPKVNKPKGLKVLKEEEDLTLTSYTTNHNIYITLYKDTLFQEGSGTIIGCHTLKIFEILLVCANVF